MDVRDNQKSHLVCENSSKAAEIIKKVESLPDLYLVIGMIMKINWPKPLSPSRIPARRREAGEVSPPQMSA